MKRIVNESEYLQVVGLLTLAGQYSKRMDEVKKSVCELLDIDRNESGPSDRVMDALYGYNVNDAVAATEELLRLLEIQRVGKNPG